MHEPLVSIGIPVYNGADYIAETLDSIVAQTHRNLEVIVCDNCSTDRTPDIVREYAAKDARITLLVNQANLGAAGNFNRALHEATAEYFTWLSADDAWQPTYVERAVEVLEARPEVVAVYSHATRINERSEVIGNYREAMGKLRLDSDSPSIRFNDSVLGFPAIVLFGVMRRQVMLDTPGHGAYIGGDRVFISEMALKGQIARVDDELFLRRVHAGAYSAMTNRKAKARWFDSENTGGDKGAINRIREHHAALKRGAPDKATYRSGLVTLFLRFPLVLAKPLLFNMVQRVLGLFGRSIDQGKYAS
ncbi:MAG: glycosyltransferase family A protein [Acidimicrobiales bacterium]